MLIVGYGSVALSTLIGAKLVALMFAGATRAIAYRALMRGEIRRDLATRRQVSEPQGDLRFSVVVPAFEEEARIADSVGHITAALASVHAQGGVEVVVVDDGSRDSTAERAEAAGARVVRFGKNQGKGAAVRAGVLVARGRTVAFTDADLAYPPSVLGTSIGSTVRIGPPAAQMVRDLLRVRRWASQGAYELGARAPDSRLARATHARTRPA